jgi:hypothetical protein
LLAPGSELEYGWPNQPEAGMSSVYNPESETIAEIERLELEVRDVRRRVEHARSEEDKRVLNRQLDELKNQIEFLRSRLP